MRLDELEFGKREGLGNSFVRANIPLPGGKLWCDVIRHPDSDTYSVYLDNKADSQSARSTIKCWKSLDAFTAQCILYELLKCNPQE